MPTIILRYKFIHKDNVSFCYNMKNDVKEIISNDFDIFTDFDPDDEPIIHVKTYNEIENLWNDSITKKDYPYLICYTKLLQLFECNVIEKNRNNYIMFYEVNWNF